MLIKTSNVLVNIKRTDFYYTMPWFYNHDFALRFELNGDSALALEIIKFILKDKFNLAFLDQLDYSNDEEYKEIFKCSKLIDTLKGKSCNYEELRLECTQFEKDEFAADFKHRHIFYNPRFSLLEIIKHNMFKIEEPTIHLTSTEIPVICSIYDERGMDVIFFDLNLARQVFYQFTAYLLANDLSLMMDKLKI